MPQNADARLTDLEVRYTYLERMAHDLDQVVIELRAQIDRLERRVTELAGATRNGPDGGGEPAPADEKPPHY